MSADQPVTGDEHNCATCGPCADDHRLRPGCYDGACCQPLASPAVRERHVMPFPPDGEAHRNGTACQCRPAIHRASDGAYEFIHQAIAREPDL